eukprot:CAMPEP_0202909328 /NCGR_PEP_ID=MMETSP1392-20130828/49024_1 /ASSEMBLY_ACC=CAM_ASM_000868 /TAXON_ID=225041 /ORGANISM="Chlamydomonas chlamydogama, Strain SAG 11-48b" /LENGTH=1054 /DNA_ID=CAMNT_0049599039 /DNA_START=77 /DNA_END=3241 /DNA_ORIENTATION=+
MSNQELRSTSRGTRIQVVVRVRPVLPTELNEEVAVTCTPDGSKVQVLMSHRDGGKQMLPGATRSGARSYDFDACLTGSTSQDELFELCGMQELVEAALNGYSVTVFAFGQTGSGKTHTMIGPRLSRAADEAAGGEAGPGGTARRGGGSGGSEVSPDDGLLTRCLHTAYAAIAARKEEAEFSVSASCLELYNEAVTDLLSQDKNKQLQVRQDQRDGFQVSGLQQVACPTAVSAIRQMQRALAHRHTRAHKLNNYSSRSHCLMTFVFASKEKAAGDSPGDARPQGSQGGIRRYGKLVLVDLAGSERLKETGNTEREAVRETGSINKSLFTLGQVLAALSSRGAGGPSFIPYRDSKLTQLLWDGLRGTGRALMLACLAPTAPFAEESLNTLHFASMALRIKSEPVVLLDPQDQLVLDLRNTIRELQAENRQLAASLQQLSSGCDVNAVLSSLPDKLRGMATPTPQPPGTSPAMLGGASAAPLLPPAAGALATSCITPPWRGGVESRLVSSSGQADVLQVRTPNSGMSSHGRAGQAPGDQQRQAAAGSSPSRRPPPAASSSQGPAAWAQQHPQAAIPARGPGQPRARSVEAQRSPGPGTKQGVRRKGGQSPGSMPLFRDPAAAGAAGPLASLGPGSVALQRASASSPGRPGMQQRTLARQRSHGSKDGLAQVLQPAPQPELDLFPELAALEMQFQQQLGLAGSEGHTSRVAGGSEYSAAAKTKSMDGSGPRDQDAAAAGSANVAAASEARAGGMEPEVKALQWAARNTWFGSDMEMTSFAYRTHDDLVDVQGMDPASDQYYAELERRVAEQFPDRWAQAHGGRRQDTRKAPPPPATGSPPKSHGAHLRVHVKDLLAPGTVAAGAGSSPVRAAQQQPRAFFNLNFGSNGNSWGNHTGATPPANMARAHASPPAGPRSGSNPPAQPGSAPSGSHPSSRGSSGPPSAGLATPSLPPQTPGTPSLINPFNLHSLAPPKPPPASRAGPPPPPPYIPYNPAAGRSMVESVRSELPSYEAVQMEYLRQRAAVLEELKRAKEDAEVERARIMAKIGKVLGSSRWRS